MAIKMEREKRREPPSLEPLKVRPGPLKTSQEITYEDSWSSFFSSPDGPHVAKPIVSLNTAGKS